MSEDTKEPELDAVIIVKKVSENGDIGTSVVTQGDVLPTEVQTLIELGLAGWRKSLGL